MEYLFRGIAKAGGIEVAPEHRIFPPSKAKARRSRTGPGLARRLLADARGGAPFRAVEALSVWRRRRAAIDELSALNDRMLKDIGLHRGEIRFVVQNMIGSETATRAEEPVSKAPARRPALADTFLGARPCAQPC